MSDKAVSAWQDIKLGGRLPAEPLFGLMYEDWRVEAELFAPKRRVFSIASAGCTAFALSALGHRVTAVDINTAQVEYARARLDGSAPRPGRIDGLIKHGRSALALVGMTRGRLRAFLELSQLEEQLSAWRRHFDTWRFRAFLSVLLQPLRLGRIFEPQLVEAIPFPFARILRRRLERGWATHPNRENPYAWQLLLGEDPPGFERVPPRRENIELLEADAAAYLEQCPRHTFDAFTLSNILDGVSRSYRKRLEAAISRAARPGAIVVLRSFSEPDDEASNDRARQDRSPLWGAVRVTRV